LPLAPFRRDSDSLWFEYESESILIWLLESHLSSHSHIGCAASHRLDCTTTQISQRSAVANECGVWGGTDEIARRLCLTDLHRLRGILRFMKPGFQLLGSSPRHTWFQISHTALRLTLIRGRQRKRSVAEAHFLLQPWSLTQHLPHRYALRSPTFACGPWSWMPQANCSQEFDGASGSITSGNVSSVERYLVFHTAHILPCSSGHDSIKQPPRYPSCQLSSPHWITRVS